MATEGVRRSGRTRKQVKTYAEEQAEENDIAAAAAPPAKRRKKVIKEEADFSEHAEANDDAFLAPAPKRAKKATQAVIDPSADNYNDFLVGKTSTASTSLPKSKLRLPKDDGNWHADTAEQRIARTKSKVRALMPGQEETRLRE